MSSIPSKREVQLAPGPEAGPLRRRRIEFLLRVVDRPRGIYFANPDTARDELEKLLRREFGDAKD